MPQSTIRVETAQNEGRSLDIRVYKRGRKCSKPGCITRLSIYTPGIDPVKGELVGRQNPVRKNWCNAHMAYGLKKELKILEDRAKARGEKASKKYCDKRKAENKKRKKL